MKKILLACALLASSGAYAGDKEEGCMTLRDLAFSMSEARQDGVSLRELKSEIPKSGNQTEQGFYNMAMMIADLVYEYPIAKDEDTRKLTHIVSSSQVYLVCMGS